MSAWLFLDGVDQLGLLVRAKIMAHTDGSGHHLCPRICVDSSCHAMHAMRWYHHKCTTNPTSQHLTNNLSGYTLGGGHGPFTRLFGLGSDQLLEADVVLANGDLATVNVEVC